MEYNLQYSLLYFAIEFIKHILVLWGILDFPFKKQKYCYAVILLPIIFIFIITKSNVKNTVSIMEIYMPILTIISVSVVLQGKILKKLLYAVLMFICITFFDICVGGILSLSISITLADMAKQPTLNAIASSSITILLSVAVLIKKKRKGYFGNIYISKNIFALIFALACTGVFFVGSLMITNLPGAGERTRKFVLFVFLVFSFAVFCVSLMLVFISKSRDTYKILSQINQDIITSQQRYYILANEKQQEIRSIRHEMKNHFSCIDALYKNNKIDEMHEYINQIIGQTEAIEELFDTGNDIVNAILNDADSRYQKDGIGIRLIGAFPKELYITSMDLCVIFANAVSNAIEAILKMKRTPGKKHYITIKIGSFKEDLFIEISNPVDQEVKIAEGKLMTTKKDKSIHGFGTSNMTQRVEKYNGTIEFQCDQDMFHVRMNLKNK